MSRKEDVINLLAATDDFISGQQICESLGVSRTAVWKIIKQLETQGYDIEAVTNKGYRLVGNGDILSDVEIRRYLDTSYMAQSLVFHKETGSTNEDAKALASEGATEGTLVVADKQTAGKGRRGRSWDSPSGESVYMSLVLRPHCEPVQASCITLIMALAVIEALEDIKGDYVGDCVIKWPNDIVMNGRKICGILTEMSAELEGGMGAINHVVVGIGINCNQEGFDTETYPHATSIKLELGHEISRSRLVARIMHYFEIDYDIYKETFDMTGLVDKYNSYLVNKDRQVRILDPKGEYEAVALGIDKKGDLLVKREDGSLEAVYAGEVSVRGVYGYV